jgi:hypothetical protein
VELDPTFHFDSDSDPTYNFAADPNHPPHESDAYDHWSTDRPGVHGSILSFHGRPWLHCEPPPEFQP